MKPNIIFTFALIFVLLVIPVFGSIPSYNVVVELKNKNIEIWNKLNYSITVRGGGECSKAYYSVSTEGVMISENYIIAGRVNNNAPKLLIVEGQPTQYCFQKGEVIQENITDVPLEAGRIETEVLDLFDNVGFIELLNTGTMKPLPNSKSGYFTMNVVLSCLNNGKWYNFQGKGDFKVLAKGEEEQFITSKILAEIAIFISGFSLLISIIGSNMFRKVICKINKQIFCDHGNKKQIRK